MNEIRDAILIRIRKGDSILAIQDYLHNAACDLDVAKDYQEVPDVVMFAKAIKDADFAP